MIEARQRDEDAGILLIRARASDRPAGVGKVRWHGEIVGFPGVARACRSGGGSQPAKDVLSSMKRRGRKVKRAAVASIGQNRALDCLICGLPS